MTRRTPPPLLDSILAAIAEFDARRPAGPGGAEDEPPASAVVLAVALALLSAAGVGHSLGLF